MKIKTNTQIEPERVVTPDEVVPFFLGRAENRADGIKPRRQRAEALEGVVSRLFAALIVRGALRADQIEHIFDYDVSAED